MSDASAGVARQTDDEFLLACIHDIRLHLRRSVTRAQMLEKRAGDCLKKPDLKVHLDEILLAGGEMDILLTRLAQLAVAGGAPYDKPLGDVGILFDSALRRLAKSNVHAEVSGQLLHASGISAPYSFEIVLRELLDNALKFREGPVNITILVEQMSGNHVFGVKDTGIGFDPQYGEKIMQPLERLHSASAYPGCGLGLAICRRTVQAWGGKIWAESKMGSGATFWFSLPMELASRPS
jgi:signal transduction histidine kinase